MSWFIEAAVRGVKMAVIVIDALMSRLITRTPAGDVTGRRAVPISRRPDQQRTARPPIQ